MSKYTLQIRQMSERSMLIEWPQKIDAKILEDVISFNAVIQKSQEGLLQNHTSAYASILVHYDHQFDFEEKKKELIELYHDDEFFVQKEQKTWHVPVCYDTSLALDLNSFKSIKIDHDELIKLHTAGDYRVYMIGFLPGFLYLGGLDKRLHIPRKGIPNLKTPKGAIAIGGQQTGIYPIESPGGWHIIGQTPLSLFDLNSDIPTPIKQGDFIKFYQIDLKTYNVLNSDK